SVLSVLVDIPQQPSWIASRPSSSTGTAGTMTPFLLVGRLVVVRSLPQHPGGEAKQAPGHNSYRNHCSQGVQQPVEDVQTRTSGLGRARAAVSSGPGQGIGVCQTHEVSDPAPHLKTNGCSAMPASVLNP